MYSVTLHVLRSQPQQEIRQYRGVYAAVILFIQTLALYKSFIYLLTLVVARIVSMSVSYMLTSNIAILVGLYYLFFEISVNSV